MPMLIGFNIANVERVKIVTREEVARTYHYNTMTSFTAEPHVEEGEEVVQRVKNTIMGRLRTDDLTGGYDLECEDERLIPEVLALIDGGTLSEDGKSYSGPKPGVPTARTAFDLYLYTSDRDSGGDVKQYLEYAFPNCKGKPVSFGAKDMEFRKQAYKIESRPGDDEPTVDVNIVDTLPAVENGGGA